MSTVPDVWGGRCEPGRDAVLVTPPVFGMYAVSARLQNAPLLEVPLVDGEAGFGVDLDAVARVAEQGAAKLVFLCSPSNPTGSSVPLEGIAALATRLQGRALVVVDEAYGEFSAQPSATTLKRPPTSATAPPLAPPPGPPRATLWVKWPPWIVALPPWM